MEKSHMPFGVTILICLIAALFILEPILLAIDAAAWINDRFLFRK
ncbi:hypothetical protein NBRC3257_2712 [Gluconobacter thailandicus NBRC 3257]|uniref:Uncharacterized protein n=1 Tax=Gluconobacter thailandicus NBRC 3257 TaxID=1381097 RepID=A0ABQ0IZU5_GLUTH|nr:hypothetical protein NBRC3255_1846 [Gluconobacter thailandicus NBRC 3255]GAD27713.1 hypothetical protein NBRC3257_2712 [Gluconobacter thailandicus NBRC 3257]